MDAPGTQLRGKFIHHDPTVKVLVAVSAIVDVVSTATIEVVLLTSLLLRTKRAECSISAES